MFSVKHRGDFIDTIAYLKMAGDYLHRTNLSKYGEEGVAALKAATPKDSGVTADSWHYKITRGKFRTTVTWYNTNMDGTCPIALILQYGHATTNGSWVEGTDYINPALKPIFERMSKEAWKEVTKH